jgi:serine-type D-Ala-D-Ala carboxypeptidase/endopeptidase (penicillin-binding protein 4)
MGHSIEREVETSAVFAKGLTGFFLQDAESGQVLCASHADNYFVPASNTKIITLATCLQVLGDSLPTLEYAHTPDGMLFRGVGDPTFLHPQFGAWQTGIALLRTAPDSNLAYVDRRFEAQRFGLGWMWDDYHDAYQPERNALPMYGNCLTVLPDGSVQPPFFQKNFYPKNNPADGPPIVRHEWHNIWLAERNYTPEEATAMPFRVSDTPRLLADTLHRPDMRHLDSTDHSLARLPWRTLYACPTDTVYRHMMHHSDNLFAEQLLLMAAYRRVGRFREDTMIDLALSTLLPESATPPRWVDGSGMSRYNLFTPRYMASVLRQMYRQQPRQRLFDLFPAGGVSGTVSGWYTSPTGQPYVFAKTGSMSGVHCLSGYVVCRSGRVLVFSFMHNNFVGSSKPWKEEMQRILREVWARW